ncbi:adipokinetic hormone/corazonin-related peptide receptor variant I-like isoform X2 [Ostrea edulis]|uniref:adipokinetic hormone/corazonin-related peptide receptor variant I-like isoform X2 n=1 Tax=Ostrea edulis TaxID=37623 RepID=UPI002095BBDF|nr:adipokinetic hormone/corazonin-related peptide receptor variant I-like isoform X2 [Ostrea edulis]
MSSETDSTIRFNRSVPFEDVYTTAPNDGILFMKFSCQNGFDDIQRNGSCKNQTDEVLPMDLVFTDENMVTIVAYTCMFIVAACGNLTVFITLFRNRNIKSRVNQFIFHLSIADLVVTFIMLPLEIIWNITVAWKAGDPACRILMFFRILGLYLSSFILVTISLDRYFAIVHPLSLNDADKRGRIMLILAWCFSIVASIPQSVIFHVETHPKHKTFTQCVTFNFFPSDNHELAYNLFNLITLYALPLLIITTSYSLILWEISKKTKQCKVSVFVVCWTPYFVLSAWWWFDRESASQLDPKVQRGLFLFAVSNSCMDPIVYGMFTINFKREFVRCCCCLKSSWKRHKLQRLTGKFQTSTGIQRGPVSQTASNNSCRSLQGTNVVKFCDDPALWRNGGGPALSQMNTGSNRANVNNFTKMNLPSLTKTTPNTAP